MTPLRRWLLPPPLLLLLLGLCLFAVASADTGGKFEAHRVTHLPGITEDTFRRPMETEEAQEEAEAEAVNEDEDEVEEDGSSLAMTHEFVDLEEEEEEAEDAEVWREHASFEEEQSFVQSKSGNHGNDGDGEQEEEQQYDAEEWASVGGEVPFGMYAGSFEVDPKHGGRMFYWLAESWTLPETAPLLIWLSGGPGCSSELALFDENGPFKVTRDLTLRGNPYSWNKVANVLFIDQPIGTGLSVVEDDRGLVSSEKQVGEHLWIFLQHFLDAYPAYRSRDVFLFGESYAGHYVPAVAHKIMLMNRYLRRNRSAEGRIINLRGIGVGNGMTDPKIQYGSYAPFAYYHGLIDEKLFNKLQNVQYPACLRAMESKDPRMESRMCNGIIGRVRRAEGSLNVYDVSKQCPPGLRLCYDFAPIAKYLDMPGVREALHVDRRAGHWKACNLRVHRQFSRDWWTSQKKEVADLLEEYPILFYNGANDFICNFVGTDSWLRTMDWPGKSTFEKSPRAPWRVDGETRGFMKRAKNLRFLVVLNAGHMVPMDQPSVSLVMLKTFIDGTL